MKKQTNYLIRMTTGEKTAMQKRAKRLGLSLASYIRYLATLEAQTKIKVK